MGAVVYVGKILNQDMGNLKLGSAPSFITI